MSPPCPGINISFDQPIMDNVLESISQIDGQVVIKVFGDDSTALRNKAKEMCAAIADVRGVDTACVDRAGEVPQTVIEIDRKAAARYGLNIGDIEDVIETGLAGKAATELWEGEKHFSIVVRLPEAQRSLANLKKILVDTPDGLHIPLEQVATFKETSGSMNISREDNTRFSAISVFIKGRDMGSVVADMQARLAKFPLPHGWFVTWGGEFESQQRAMKRLSIIVPISIFLDFCPAVQRLQIREKRAADFGQCAAGTHRRHLCAAPHGHSLERFGRHRFHRALWPGRSQWRRHGQLLQPASGRGIEAL